MATFMIGDFEVSDDGIDKYLSLTELGKLFGVSGVIVGRWLVNCGLREKYVSTEGKTVIIPTEEARDGGYIQEEKLPNDIPFYLWHRDRTIHALIEAGHTLLDSK